MNELMTTVFEKVQVGTPAEPHDKFIIRCTGKTGGFGWPVFTEAERDTVWPPGDFPDPDWKGATIYNETIERVQFNTGSTWFTFEAGSAPANVAAFYQQYPDDATYIVNNGPAVNGSVYYNTTVSAVRVFSNGTWYNDLIPEPWTNSTSYNIGQIVWVGIKIYRCVTAHTSNVAGTIEDDIANWVAMGAYNVSELDDVDLTGIVDGDILEWLTDKFVVSRKGTLQTALTLKELAADPLAPAAGYVNIFAKTDKRIYLQDSDNRVTLLEVPLNTIATVRVPGSTINNTGAWTEVIAVTSAEIRRTQVFDLIGETYEIGVGAAGSEVVKFQAPAGAGDPFDDTIPVGSRIAVRAVTGPDPVGAIGGATDFLVFNFLG